SSNALFTSVRPKREPRCDSSAPRQSRSQWTTRFPSHRRGASGTDRPPAQTQAVPPPRRLHHHSVKRVGFRASMTAPVSHLVIQRYSPATIFPRRDWRTIMRLQLGLDGRGDIVGRGGGEQVIDSKRKRGDFKEKRNVDSGVWMGSDESGADSLIPSEDGPWGEDLLKTVLDPKAQGKSAQGPLVLLPSGKAAPPVLPLPVLKGPHESEGQRFARSVVNDCLEKGEDIVDLGNFNLRTIPSGLLRPLQHLTKLPSVEQAPLSENSYSSLQPFLSIYLPGNSLNELPNELFELSGLKVLSVRNNELHEIPFTIRKLKELEVLNVSVNRLTYLPWELLRLLQHGELKHMTAYPNPFPSIEEATIAKWHREPEKKTTDQPYDEYDSEQDEPEITFETPRFDIYEDSPPAEAWTTIHVATGPTTRLDMEGRPIEENPVSNMMIPSSDPVPTAPSLREVALRAVCKLPDLEHVTDEELADFPALVIPLMQQVKKNTRSRWSAVLHMSEGVYHSSDGMA
ncbi:hypothetical protein N7494_001567, partial [Penicillium frequentans]